MGGEPVLTLGQVAAGAVVDRPVYVLGADSRQWDAFVAPAGPHAGHLLVLRRLRFELGYPPAVPGGARSGPGRMVGQMMCARCPGRPRWPFTEYLDPGQDPYRHAGGPVDLVTRSQVHEALFRGC